MAERVRQRLARLGCQRPGVLRLQHRAARCGGGGCRRLLRLRQPARQADCLGFAGSDADPCLNALAGRAVLHHGGGTCGAVPDLGQLRRQRRDLSVRFFPGELRDLRGGFGADLRGKTLRVHRRQFFRDADQRGPADQDHRLNIQHIGIAAERGNLRVLTHPEHPATA